MNTDLLRSIHLCVFFSGIPSISNENTRSILVENDLRLFTKAPWDRLLDNTMNTFSNRLGVKIRVHDLFDTTHTALLGDNQIDTFERVRHFIRNAISWYQIESRFQKQNKKQNRILLCGRSMGILASLLAGGAIGFDDGVFISFLLGDFHTKSYLESGLHLVSTKLYKVSNNSLNFFLKYVDEVTLKKISHNIFVLEHDPLRQTLIQYPEKYKTIIEKSIRELKLSSSKSSNFPSCAHTPLTQSKVPILLNALRDIHISPPNNKFTIYSQSAKSKSRFILSVSDIYNELIDIMTTPINIKPLYGDIAKLKNKYKNLTIVEVLSNELSLGLSAEFLINIPIIKHDPFTID